MDTLHFDQWVKKILATEEEEISCTDCFDMVSTYVDAELAGGEMGEPLHRVKHHLDQCKACHDEYELIHELAVMDMDGEEPEE